MLQPRIAKLLHKHYCAEAGISHNPVACDLDFAEFHKCKSSFLRLTLAFAFPYSSVNFDEQPSVLHCYR